jgi:hypothetical protein
MHRTMCAKNPNFLGPLCRTHAASYVACHFIPFGLKHSVGAGGVIGGVAGTLIGAGIPEYEAKRDEGRIKKGGILISVHCDDSNWTHKAKTILEETGAEDVSSTGEARADFARTDKPLPRRRVHDEA